MRRGGALTTALHVSAGLLAVPTVQGCGDDWEPEQRRAMQHRAQAVTSVGDETAQEVRVETRDRRTITITGNAGDGCDVTLVPAQAAEKRGLLQVYFDSYGLKLPAGGARASTKQCTLTLRVAGAAGHRYAILSVLYVGGYAMLTPGAEARFDATVSWAGRTALGSVSAPMLLRVPDIADPSWVPSAQWTYNQELVQQEDHLSRCLEDEQDADEVVLRTALTLDNKDGRYDAELELVSLSGQASVVANAPASMVVALEPRPCR